MRLSLKQTVPMAILCGSIAAGFCAVNTPRAADSERIEQVASVSVDRVNKADRLPSRAALATHVNGASPTVARKRPPLGCDRVFSPMTNPGQAGIYKRCMA